MVCEYYCWKLLEFNVEFYWAVVAAHYMGVDLGVDHLVAGIVAHQEVVDAPAGILRACLETVAPPGVDAFHVGVEMAPAVGESCVEQSGHFLALLVGETGVLAVGLGVLEVYLLVGNVKVAAHYHRFFLVEINQIVAER